jgi:hypothetical protein
MPTPATDAATRILRATIELRQLEFDIRACLELLPSQPIQAEPIDAKIAAEFRDALDLVRHSIWAYQAARGADSPQQAQGAVQQYRMNRVTQMLRMLRATGSQEVSGSTEAEGFIEQVHAMAALTVDKHQTLAAKKASAA